MLSSYINLNKNRVLAVHNVNKHLKNYIYSINIWNQNTIHNIIFIAQAVIQNLVKNSYYDNILKRVAKNLQMKTKKIILNIKLMTDNKYIYLIINIIS